MRGGYQIVDLSTAVVGTETVVKDIYQTIKHFDGKPVFIITPNASGVFAEFTESSGMYLGAYIGSNSHLFTVSIISSNRVTITDKGPAGGGGTSNYNELSNKPAIAGTTLSGDKSLLDLGIQGALTEGANITIEDNEISANVTASSVSYDNTISGMSADDVQAAITELNSKSKSYFKRTTGSGDTTSPSGDSYHINIDNYFINANSPWHMELYWISKPSSSVGASVQGTLPSDIGDTFYGYLVSLGTKDMAYQMQFLFSISMKTIWARSVANGVWNSWAKIVSVS